MSKQDLKAPVFAKERTLIILKPDAIQRSLVGEIISRIERVGLKFVAFKFLVPKREQLLAHYNKDDEWFLKKGQRIIDDLKSHGAPIEKEALEYGRDIIETIITYMQLCPVLIAVVEGNESVGIVKKLVGETEPSTSDIGTIRGDLTSDSYGYSTYRKGAVRNLIHCSGEKDEALHEISVWFTPQELMDYRLAQEQIMEDINFDNKRD